MNLGTIKTISRLQLHQSDLDHVFVTVAYQEPSKHYIEHSLNFKVRVVMESRFVKLLNMLPWCDFESVFFRDAVWLCSGVRKWGTLSKFNETAVQISAFYMAYKRLYYADWLEFYGEWVKPKIRRELRSIAEHFILVLNHWPRPQISESTC